MSKVIICGGRDFTDQDLFDKSMEAITSKLSITTVVSGMARGTDMMGYRWAKANGIPVQEYPADWDKYGDAAGPIRNQQMLDEEDPDYVIAFPGGTGTRDMTQKAIAAHKPVLEVSYDG